MIFSNKKSFTLIEVLIVLALTSLIIVFSLPLFNLFKINRKLDIQQNKIIDTLRLAQNKSQTGLDNSSYGVYFETDGYVFFKGDSYETRDTQYDIEYELPSGFSLSGLEEVVFYKITGRPSSSGNLVITETSSGRTRTISINSLGLIQRQ